MNLVGEKLFKAFTVFLWGAVLYTFLTTESGTTGTKHVTVVDQLRWKGKSYGLFDDGLWRRLQGKHAYEMNAESQEFLNRLYERRKTRNDWRKLVVYRNVRGDSRN